MKKAYAAITLFLLPVLASAQGQIGSAPTTGGLTQGNGIDQTVMHITVILNNILLLLMAVAVVVFFWGLIQYIVGKDPKEGIKTIIAGLVSLLVMVTLFGIVHLVASTFGISGGGAARPPIIQP